MIILENKVNTSQTFNYKNHNIFSSNRKTKRKSCIQVSLTLEIQNEKEFVFRKEK